MHYQHCYLLDKLIGFEYNGNRYIYQKNIQGDIIKIYNEETQELEEEYNYDAWGNVLVTNYTSENIGNVNPIRYRGYYYDEETGLFWLSSRYYSPELCRVISLDSVDYLEPESINGLNLYAYAKNNQIMYYDPPGHSAILIGLIIEAVIEFGTAAYIDYQDDGEIFNGSVKWYDYLGGYSVRRSNWRSTRSFC